MRISEILDILKTQVSFQRTLKGRPITEKAVEVINASLEDEKNWGNDAVRCKNCGIILSGLLVPEGCVNCGCKDLSDKIIITKGE